MYQYHNHSGNAIQALRYLNAYTQKKDSLQQQELLVRQEDIGKELKDRAQQLEIQLLRKDNQLGRIYTWVFAILSAMAIVIIGLVYYLWRKGKQNLRQMTQLNATITAQKKEQEQTMEQLAVSVVEKEKILYIVAHELRSPISGITSVASMLQQYPNSAEQGELLQLIEHTSASSHQLINELLQSQEESSQRLELATMDINTLVSQCVALLQFKASEKKQQIVVHLLSDACVLHIDASKIERAMNNLLNNAIKFSPVQTVINVELVRKADAVCISVADRGIGIPQEMQEQIFNLFTDAKRKGTAGEKSFGMGLSITKQIVENHQGRLWVESEEGKGATFYVELPLA
jgi:signal transduction histidine kinase